MDREKIKEVKKDCESFEKVMGLIGAGGDVSANFILIEMQKLATALLAKPELKKEEKIKPKANDLWASGNTIYFIVDALPIPERYLCRVWRGGRREQSLILQQSITHNEGFWYLLLRDGQPLEELTK